MNGSRRSPTVQLAGLSLGCTLIAWCMLLDRGFANWPWTFALVWFSLVGASTALSIVVIAVSMLRRFIDAQHRALAVVLALPAILFTSFCAFIFVVALSLGLGN